MTARTFVGHQRGLPLATSEDINLAIDSRWTRSPTTAVASAPVMGSLIKKRRKRMRKKKHKKMLRRTRHQRRK